MDLKQNQKGQIIVESMLLLVLLMGIMTFAVGQMKKMDFIKSLTVDPWARVSGMVECGVWSPCGVSAGNSGGKQHPHNRIVTFKPQ